MSILFFVAAAWLVFGTLVVIANIGKPRKPITHGQANTVLVINVLLIALMVYGGLHL